MRRKTTAPITIPAMAPPLKRLGLPPLLDAPAPFVADADGDCDEVEEVVADAAAMGRVTPWQRCSVLEKTQQESVEFADPAAQYEHRPPRLEAKPQFSRSFTSPGMHEPASDLAGRAQLVRSARIWLSALGPVVPQRRLLEMPLSV